jgi:hypothetical protein
MHEVDDGNEDHAVSEDWRIGIAAIGLGKYLSDGGKMPQWPGPRRSAISAQPRGAAHG